MSVCFSLSLSHSGEIDSWIFLSHFRSYRNGYVWNDLAENDVVMPADGLSEYILKGSEIIEPCSGYSPSLTFRERKGCYHLLLTRFCSLCWRVYSTFVIYMKVTILLILLFSSPWFFDWHIVAVCRRVSQDSAHTRGTRRGRNRGRKAVEESAEQQKVISQPAKRDSSRGHRRFSAIVFFLGENPLDGGAAYLPAAIPELGSPATDSLRLVNGQQEQERRAEGGVQLGEEEHYGASQGGAEKGCGCGGGGRRGGYQADAVKP